MIGSLAQGLLHKVVRQNYKDYNYGLAIFYNFLDPVLNAISVISDIVPTLKSNVSATIYHLSDTFERRVRVNFNFFNFEPDTRNQH